MPFVYNLFLQVLMLLKVTVESVVNVLRMRNKLTTTVRLDGKYAVVTGANNGIGKETALQLSLRGAMVVMACRDMDKGVRAANAINEANPSANLLVMKLDLSSLASVRQFASELYKRVPHVDLLVNNAGVMMTPEWRTADGFELQFGTNHLGHFLLTLLLLSLVRASPTTARIVTVSSTAHMGGDIHFGNIHLVGEYTPTKAYYQSKLANVLFSRELAKRLRAYGIANVNAYSLHPGVIKTDLWQHASGLIGALNRLLSGIFYLNERDGALTTLYCALEPGLEHESGHYYDNCRRVDRMVRRATDDQMAKQLWELSCKLVELEPHLRLAVV